MEKLYFVTGNNNKFEEMQEIVESDGIELEKYSLTIHELQTENVNELVKRKAFAAFTEIRRPLIVEHTMLKIDAFNHLPGPQTNYIYSQLGYKKIVEFCRHEKQFGASAESVFCYCDGKQYVIARGEEKGKIVTDADTKGDAFDWDRIFKPDEHNEDNVTYACMSGSEKKQRSMRRKAWEALKSELGQAVLDRYKSPASGAPLSGMVSRSELDTLAELIRQKKVMLFIGAGISKSVKMPLWNELLKSLMGNEYDSELFETYGDNMMLAEYIRQKRSDQFVYEKMQEIFHIGQDVSDRLQNSAIYKAIMDLDCPVIYTTNYDHLIEEYYRMKKGENSFDRVVTAKDMRCLKSGGPRIMKFHGDISDKESIVLTESEYFGRMDFQNFMDVQLQADMLRYHVLFLGYSLSDINVKMLLYLARKRQKSSLKDPKSSGEEIMKNYVFTVTPNQIQEEVFHANQIITLSGEEAEKEAGTQAFLQQLSRLVKGTKDTKEGV